MHVIRLRGPFDRVEAGAESPPLSRIDVPLAALPQDLSGARLLRRFGYPTGIEPGDRIILEAKQFPAGALLLLNGEPLGEIPAEGTLRREVGTKLKPRSTLEVVLPQLAESPALQNRVDGGWLQVQLEIVPS